MGVATQITLPGFFADMLITGAM